MKAQHTPGPAVMCRFYDSQGHVVAEATARPCRTYRAAPAMLAICERLLELIDSGDIPNVGDWEEAAQLRAVIGQATRATP